MQSPVNLSVRDARKLFLKQQGLLHKNEFGKGKHAIYKSLRQLGYVQIDTISVVNRAHEHILATRIDRARPKHLDQLIRERKVFEYWSHAAAFLPIEDYRYTLPVKRGWQESRQCDQKLAKDIVSRIRAEGPLSSRHFEDSRRSGGTGWWDWKPAKQVLEHLFLAGDLMVSYRENFQKVYDLPERILPSDLDTSWPSIDEWCEYLVTKYVRALGVANERDIGYAKPTIRRLSKIDLKKPLQAAVSRMCESGQLTTVQVDGQKCYSSPALLDQLPLKSNKGPVKLLSPFDNLVINRQRTQSLFGFDYLLECYVPEAKRQYGYFSLPLLYGDELIGRLDAKADRKSKTLTIKSLHLEGGVPVTDRLVDSLSEGIRHFATDHDSESIRLDHCPNKTLKQALEPAL